MPSLSLYISQCWITWRIFMNSWLAQYEFEILGFFNFYEISLFLNSLILPHWSKCPIDVWGNIWIITGKKEVGSVVTLYSFDKCCSREFYPSYNWQSKVQLSESACVHILIQMMGGLETVVSGSLPLRQEDLSMIGIPLPINMSSLSI